MDLDTFFLFSPFWLDLHNEQLWHGTQAIALRPKTFSVLWSLVSAAGQLLPRDTLRALVWGSTVVSDTVIRNSIREIRAALDDTAQHPRFIQTVHRRGYRFIAPVTVADVPPHVSSPSPEALQWTWRSPLSAPELPHFSEAGAALDEEYKLVTVLCWAVTDAPGLAVARGPEAMYRLMQTLSAVTQEAIQHHGGTICHLTGEACQAVFGAPVAQEDHARRAILAALELRQQLRARLPDEAHVPSLGLHTGPVIVGRLTAAQAPRYTVVGETVHEASQLQCLAPPGAIFMSAATHQLVQTEVRVTLCDTPASGGPESTFPVYTLHGLTQRRAGVVGYGTRHESRFVGREQELVLLTTRLALVQEGHGQVISLTGEPGIGKTRLLTEFHRSLAGQPITYWEGHGFPDGSTTPYLLVCDLFRQMYGLTAADGVEDITTRVQRSLAETGFRPAHDISLLLQLLGVPRADAQPARLSPQGLKSQTFALLRDIVLHHSQHQPLILAVENLHWVDATSEAWLTALVEHLAGAAVMLLVTHRPGYRPPWLAQSIATHLVLPPLRPEQSQAVMQSMLQTTSFPDALMQTIIARAAGNPFFLEELVWEARAQPAHPAVLGIPETVHAVLAARLDRLPSLTKHLLQTAAAIGTNVDVSLLQQVAAWPAETIQQGLTQLQNTDFLSMIPSAPERVYTFRHALIHEVAYGSLLYERRRVLHVRIMEGLETLYAGRVDDYVEVLAQHAFQGELWPQALAYYRQAGEKALGRSAHHEAVQCFEQALVALQRLSEQSNMHIQAIELRLAMRSALLPSGDTQRILTYLYEAETLAEELNDSQRLGRVSHFLAVHHYFTGAYAQATTSAQRALTLAAVHGHVVLHTLANLALGAVHHAQGSYGRAINCLTSLDGAGRHELSGQMFMPAVFSRILSARCHAELGRFDEARALGEAGLRIAAAGAHPSSMILAYWGLSHVFVRRGNLHRAMPLLEQARGLSEGLGFPVHFVRIMAALGAVYSLGGRVTDALSLCAQALQQCTMVERVHLKLKKLCLLPFAEAQMLAGCLEEASNLARQALELSQLHQERGNEAYALCLLGDIAARDHALTARVSAAAHYHQSLALARALGMRPLQAHCHQRLGSLYIQIDRRALAYTALSAAMALYRAMDMTFWLPQAEASLAQLETR